MLKMEPKKVVGKKLETQPIKLIDLIDYQEGSVVSRTIIDRKAVMVTLFAFDEGQGVSEHTAPYTVLGYLVDGEAEITISGHNRCLKEGEMISIPANKPHALKAVKRFKMLLIMIHS